jgi:hypothetical protein
MGTDEYHDDSVEIGKLRTHHGDAVILRGTQWRSHVPSVRLVIEDYVDFAYMLSEELPEETARLEKDEFFVNRWYTDVFFLTMMLATGLFEDTGKRIKHGDDQFEIWRCTAGKID